jgi:glycosyltransferase involved in cell wall biosynthesis
VVRAGGLAPHPETRPDATFTSVGSDPSPAIRALASADHGIEVTGTVMDVRTYLRRAAVSVAPLLTARGVQNKALEAISEGLPSVATSPVANGLPTEVQPACRADDTPEDFAQRVIELLALEPAMRRAIAGRANLAALSWERQLEPLMETRQSGKQLRR